MKIIHTEKMPIKMWSDGITIEDEAIAQLKNLANLPFIYKHVAVMPDSHWGMGATVGSVIATQGAICPAAVGVDIGCGMMATRLDFKIDEIENLRDLRHSIERSIPVGFETNKEITERMVKSINTIMPNGDSINKKHLSQIGTLGGGNHFIEICHDADNQAWVMLHSGSRNIGKTLAEKHIQNAKDLMKQYFINLPDPDLAYFVQNTEPFKNYINDVLYCQQFAMANREEMMTRLLKDISFHMYKEEKPITNFVVNCHHNFTRIENHFGHNVWITRKGAVSARQDEWGIIPGSMGTKSYIVQGKGNLESFCSCSHGAGRAMSRNEAKRRFTIEDHIEATKGVECRKDDDLIDETPKAYKDIDLVMAAQADLVEVKYILKQILCVKG